MNKIIPLEDGDYYLSEEGYKVFTEHYLLKEGIAAKVVVGIVHMDIVQKRIRNPLGNRFGMIFEDLSIKYIVMK